MFSTKNVFPIANLARYNSTAATFVNRNPRNLERMRIARKPDGYHLERPGRVFWHKLMITPTNRTVKAEVIHFVNGSVIEAKTSELALRNQLYSMTDTCAYINLGRVFAQRCLECGITEMACDIESKKGSKIDKFLNEVVKGGIKLVEEPVYKKPEPWDWIRTEKPWEVTEE
ncbi:39S ribosomal protein L18, mitochondrial [Vanessa atalanta]|uniref:39S ribosomal protein L18, mitochondrial n=1 Tax=Vanessa atalanta TaxID=42275 RepID=UPI001FCDA631|nr:39S ribosomal protein L18, mitochondrial [Vanessa atalanta]